MPKLVSCSAANRRRASGRDMDAAPSMAASSAIHRSMAASRSGGVRTPIKTASTRGRPGFLLTAIDFTPLLITEIDGPNRGGNPGPALTANHDPKEIAMFPADQSSSTMCAVAPLAHEAVQLLHARRRYVDKSDDLLMAVLARLDQLEEAASLGRATSSAGLFFQACVALAGMSIVEGFVDDPQRSQAGHRLAENSLIGLALATYTEDLRMLADYYAPPAFAMSRAA